MTSYQYVLRRQSATQVGSRHVLVSRGISGPAGATGATGAGGFTAPKTTNMGGGIPYSVYGTLWSGGISVAHTTDTSAAMFYLPRAITVTELYCYLASGTAASTTGRFGIYSTGADITGTLTLVTGGDLGTIDTSSTGAKSITSLSVALAADSWYVVLFNTNDTGNPQFNTFRAAPLYVGSGTLVNMTDSGIHHVDRITKSRTYGAMASSVTSMTAGQSVPTSGSGFYTFISLTWTQS